MMKLPMPQSIAREMERDILLCFCMCRSRFAFLENEFSHFSHCKERLF